MSKTILVLLDACGFEAMQESGGTLELFVEQSIAAKYKVTGELPSLSRPMYETVLTGLPASTHGILTNTYQMPSQSKNLFQLAKENGLVTAAAAYQWIAELYNRKGSFSLPMHRFQLEGTNTISYGIYYSEDDYPDSHLYADAEFLRNAYQPDFLLIHPMNIDYSGHQYGCDSVQYRHSILKNAEYLALCLPIWRRDGYDVIITADHGMDAMGIHGGNTKKQREVPLYLFSDRVEPGDFSMQSISQLIIAPLACHLLGIEKAVGMIDIQQSIQDRVDNHESIE